MALRITAPPPAPAPSAEVDEDTRLLNDALVMLETSSPSNHYEDAIWAAALVLRSACRAEREKVAALQEAFAAQVELTLLSDQQALDAAARATAAEAQVKEMREAILGEPLDALVNAAATLLMHDKTASRRCNFAALRLQELGDRAARMAGRDGQ